MRKNKIIKFIIIVPFLISISSFILYFKNLLVIKGGKSKVTSLMEVSLVRYRNIAVFCLLIGVILLFIKTVVEYFKVNQAIKNSNEDVFNRITNKKEEYNNKYSLSEDNIINDLLKEKTLTIKFINSDLEDRVVKFNNYDNNVINVYDKSNRKEEKKVKYVKNNDYKIVRFVINLIIILLSIIILLLCVNKINNKYKINKNNLNINNIKTVDLK